MCFFIRMSDRAPPPIERVAEAQVTTHGWWRVQSHRAFPFFFFLLFSFQADYKPNLTFAPIFSSLTFVQIRKPQANAGYRDTREPSGPPIDSLSDASRGTRPCQRVCPL